MSVRLAFGMTAGPGLRCWLPTPGDDPTPADDRKHPPGAPIAIGPAEAQPTGAVEQLTLLVAGGTEVAAGAGVDLGNGFTSARLAGAPGDRRDAVLAALKFLSAHNAHRLGDRTAALVALFGLSATKRVGAAANTAIIEERWAALQLASAVSDLLGPEQLEQVLELRAPDGVDPFPRGAASTLSEHLSQVLTRYQRPRRLALVVSLWQQVCEQLTDQERQSRLATTQVDVGHIDKLRERHRTHFDEPVLQHLGWAVGGNPTLAEAARWQPPQWWTAHELSRLLHDAIAATALLRFAKTMSDEGLAAAAQKHRDELTAAAKCLNKAERHAATRRPEDAYAHPARPGRYVHDLLQPLQPGRGLTRNTETYVKERVSMARNYGVVILDAITAILEGQPEPLHNCWDTCKPWQAPRLHQWRRATGFPRTPDDWEQPPLADAHPDAPKETLAQRIAANPSTDPAALEAPHDLLWYTDLADALAPFYGNERAVIRHERPGPWPDYNPPAPPPDPSRPRADSVPLAAASVAQLVAFGATPPPRCNTWQDLADGVQADATISEASVGKFPIPPELTTADKQPVPGTELRVELGRDPRQLAEWSSYMGNCIGQSWYAEEAHRGQCVLIALRGTDGRIAANLDIRRRAGGWQIHELRARFNDVVDVGVQANVKQWVKTLAVQDPPKPAEPEPRIRSRGGAHHRTAATRLPTALITALTTEVNRSLAAATPAQRTYATLANNLSEKADFDPTAAVVALKRLGSTQQVELLRKALAAGLSTPSLWRATSVRPLTTAINQLDPELREYDRLTTLKDDVPLPRTLRALVRRPEIAPAYAMDAVGRATRKAMGKLLNDEALTRSAARRPSPELICALVIATTCAPPSTVDAVPLTTPGTTTVPGFPTTDLQDETGPWQQALPAAAELGAPVEQLDQRIVEHGLLVPRALLGKPGWQALWHRAHR